MLYCEKSNLKKMNIDFITGFLLLATIVAELPAFSMHAGYILIFSLMLVVLVSVKTVEIRTLKLMMVIVIGWGMFVFLTPSVLNDTHYLSNSIILVGILLLLLLMKESKVELYFNKRIGFADWAYFGVYLICLFELVGFAIDYPEIWQGAIITDTFFFNHYHHVDFSIIIMSIFFIGIKRRYWKMSIFLAILACVILPSRTMQLFFLLYVILYIFRKKIIRILKYLRANKSFFWLFTMTFLVVILACFWIFVLGKYFSVGEGHDTLYNTSDYQRFESIIYAISVIIQEKLVFSGLDTGKVYSELVDWLPFSTVLGPHNSILGMILNYSLVFTGIYFGCLTTYIDKKMTDELFPFVVSYFLCSCILHDMFIGTRGFLFVVALVIPWKQKKDKHKLNHEQKINYIIKT